METFKYKPNLKKKIFATIIDYGIFILVFFVYLRYFGQKNTEGGLSVSGFLGLPIDIFWFVYFIVVENILGATLGHLAFDLRVIRLDRKKINFINSLKRHLLDPIDLLFYGIPAIITIKNTEKHQRLGDLWAKTIVIDTMDAEQFQENKLINEFQ